MDLRPSPRGVGELVHDNDRSATLHLAVLPTARHISRGDFSESPCFSLSQCLHRHHQARDSSPPASGTSIFHLALGAGRSSPPTATGPKGVQEKSPLHLVQGDADSILLGPFGLVAFGQSQTHRWPFDTKGEQVTTEQQASIS